MITPQIRKFIGKIANEHYELSNGDDKSMNFLWYLYSEGTHKDQYRPFIFAAEISSLSTDDALIRGSDRTYHCTDFNVGHGRLQVESFCRFSVSHHRDNNLIYTKVPRGYPHPCPGSLFRLSCMVARAEL